MTGAQEEAGNRAIRVAEARTRQANGLGDLLDGLVLADDLALELALHLEETLTLGGAKARDRDARPARDDLADLLDADRVLNEAAAGVLLALERLELLQALDGVGDGVVAQIGGGGEVVVALGLLGLGLERLDALAEALDLLATRLAGVEALQSRQ